MSRLHLFEFEDQPWLSPILRDGMTGWLDVMNRKNGGWDAFAPHLTQLVDASRGEKILDLCSGGGGPVVRLRRVIADTQGLDFAVLLTDKFPNHDGRRRATADPSGRVQYHAEPVDATNVPPALPGVRTMFCSFHHFPPETARRILADARDRNRAIGIFEGTARTVPALLVTLTAPLAVLAMTPFVRPLRWSQLVFTYLIPILPLMCLWDGLVSCLRSYSVSELRDLVRPLESDGYEWDVGEMRFPKTPVRVAYLTGRPRAPSEASQ